MGLLSFGAWRRLTEMASFSMRKTFHIPCKFLVMYGLPCEEKEVKAIDMRFEDPNAYPAPFNRLNQGSKFAARLPGTNDYLIYHGGDAEILSGADALAKGYLPGKGEIQSAEGYLLVPNDWAVHAQLLDADYEVMKPALADFTGARSKALS